MTRAGALVLLLAVLSAGRPTGAAEIPIADFARQAEVAMVKISPGGTHLAVLLNKGRENALAFFSAADLKPMYVQGSGANEAFLDFDWANDRRVVIQLGERYGYLDYPVNHGELYAVDADGKNGRMVFGYRAGEMQTGSHIKKAEGVYAWGEIIDLTRFDPDNILVKSTPMTRDHEAVPSVVLLNVSSGVRKDRAHGPLPATRYVTDEKGEVRVALGADTQNQTKVFYKDRWADPWRELTTLKGFTKDTRPIKFLSGSRNLYVAEPGGQGIHGLYLVNLDTGVRTSVYQDKRVDPSGLEIDPVTGEVIAIELQPNFPEYAWVDAAHPKVKLLQGLLAAYPGQHVRITSQTEDGKKAVALVTSDRNPGTFLQVDTTTLTGKEILRARKWIQPAQMAEMNPFAIRASDKLVLNGYLTLPNGVEAKGLPLVVLPHGGPHGVRDTWGFDPDAQLLASRGYAVLQLNFRGSGGYGLKFQEAGYRHWGDRVQQDLIEATRWVISQGIVDPKRICIYGGSFGAYSALQSAILAPELFRCAVGLSGVYDLALMYEEGDIRKGALGKAYLAEAIGKDPALLRARSPTAHADQIKAAVLLVHGAKDERAPIAHAERMRDALKKAGKSVEWLEKGGEAHGFVSDENRAELYSALLEFLEKHTKK